MIKTDCPNCDGLGILDDVAKCLLCDGTGLTDYDDDDRTDYEKGDF